MIPARVLRHGTQIGIWHLKIKNKKIRGIKENGWYRHRNG
jgi:hypothetical protein